MRAWIERWEKFPAAVAREIWQPARLDDRTLRGWIYAALRVISITWSVFTKTKAGSRAAALSFSSLLGLGPLVALTVLIAGFSIGNKSPDTAARILSQLLSFIAPQAGEFHAPPRRTERTAPRANANPREHERTNAEGAATPEGAAATEGATGAEGPGAQESPLSADGKGGTQLNPRLLRMMNQFIAQGRSGSAGTVGVFSLIVIVLLLFKTVEDTFNEIWGIHRGRSVVTRFVYYWTILTLGSVLFFASITLVGAGAVLGMFKNTIGHLPFSAEMLQMLRWLLPAFSFALLVAVLAVFYRVIPHTKVYWRAAFAGALVVAALLLLNNYLAFLYVRRVILTESLYGSLGFPLVVMFGLYVFWLYVLIGGQLSYAIQNVHYRNSQAAWASLPYAARERLALAVFLAICRRFQACEPPLNAPQVGNLIKVPTQLVNECLGLLVNLRLITIVPAPGAVTDTNDTYYQPAQPLSRLTLFDFKKLSESVGDDHLGGSFARIEPLLSHYQAAVERLGEEAFFKKSIEELLDQTPLKS